MTTSARKTFRWWPVDHGRHAIPGELQPGDTGETLCRHPVTYLGIEPSKREWLYPTCQVCYERARDYTHIALAGHHYESVLPAQRRTEQQPQVTR
ncbi:zinc finger protein [Goodfellowiella coeruleoviolacea]|uniref:Zinc-finger n=1 Tax=Goodfellowiella coeruleoviolacea TaxID=334858 RepID=A0AAE3GJJ1_9PSEU|nr:zinc finger protein [Goodfellowiella coeruleoviolacea]MCP2167308.1 zinc-finger [Goodfellowiella coeruleoviolacea]